MLPYGVSIEGSAIDSLRVAFIRQGLAPNEVRPAIRAFMMGPPGHINREDVRRAFPVLLQQNPARREQVVDYQPQAGMTRAEEAFEEPAFEPNADEEIIFLPPHRTETGEDTLIQEPQNLTDEDWAEAQRLQRLHRAQRRATDRTNCTVQVCLMISAQLFPPQHFGPFLAIWLSGRLDVFFLEDLKHLLH
ncbi:hypothetical protein PC116_g17359 [Phytophthora cactorum]|nr:hypothetical protein PC116_g17359 [Phytophthora cactorum]